MGEVHSSSFSLLKMCIKACNDVCDVLLCHVM